MLYQWSSYVQPQQRWPDLIRYRRKGTILCDKLGTLQERSRSSMGGDSWGFSAIAERAPRWRPYIS